MNRFGILGLLGRVACGLVVIMCASAGTPNSVDYSDLWWNPQESGWGLGLHQQDQVIFATLFVYAQDGKGTWLVASDLRQASSMGVANPTYSGVFYRTRGPSYTAPSFDSATVTVTPVGQFSISFATPYAGTLTYTVDGMSVSKQVTRQTWGGNKQIAQRFWGGVSAKADACAAGIPAAPLEMLGYAGQVPTSDSPVTFGMDGNGCRLSWTLDPHRGHLTSISNGQFTCTKSGTTTRTGTFSVSEIEMGSWGFNGHLQASDSSCTYSGAFGGHYIDDIANDDSYADLWWNPLESGWGLGVFSQNQTTFVTLFAYGADGYPVFFVGPSVPVWYGEFSGIYTPPPVLYRTEGPYFGRPFDSTAVKLSQVGTIAIPMAPARPLRAFGSH